jgi:hypothetical protein
VSNPTPEPREVIANSFTIVKSKAGRTQEATRALAALRTAGYSIVRLEPVGSGYVDADDWSKFHLAAHPPIDDDFPVWRVVAGEAPSEATP